jgi:predicted  nucleic acid-binding Zn-ribbon protein
VTAVLEGLRQLIDLQSLDDELAGAEGEQAGLPERRAQLAAKREAAERRVLEAKEALQAAETEQRQAEVDLQDREALVQKLEGQQFQVKTNEAYTALLREIEQAKEGISSSETRILETMETIEAAGAERRAAEAEAESILVRVVESEKALDAREKELAAALARLREGRAQLVACVEAEFLAQYDRIGSRHGQALAHVRHEMCEGCRVKLPPQLHIEMLRGERIITCTNCHRILIPESFERAAK